jgi:hypothetical protein
VKAVLIAMLMLASVGLGQLPPDPPLVPVRLAQEPAPLPELLGLPAPHQELTPAPPQPPSKPPVFVPVNPELHVNPPPLTGAAAPDGSVQQGAKPPALKMVDVPAPVDKQPTVQLPVAPPVDPVVPLGCVATPCLALQRSGPASAKAGLPFTYEIVVHNPGSMAVAQASLEEVLPAGSRYVGGQPTALVQGNRLVWDLQNVAPRTERRILVEVETPEGGPWRSQANLTVSAQSSLQMEVAAAPAQMLTVTGPTQVPVGHPVTFVIRLTNTTTAPLTNVVMALRMSAGLQHLQGDAIEGSLGDLAPGKTREVTLDAIATQTGRPTLDATVISNHQATASARTAVTITEQPVLSLKFLNPVTPWLDYKVEITNCSTTEQRDVLIIETLPERIEFTSSEAGSYDRAARTIRWSVDVLAPGTSRQLPFRASLSDGGPQLNRISARAGNDPEVFLHTILPGGR